MADDKIQRVHITIPQSELDDVDDFRFTQRISTRAEAIRQLIALGIKAAKKAKA